MSTVGRGFLTFTSPGEQGAFGAWFAEKLRINGGRNQVNELSGVSKDTLTKYTTGRSVPSRDTLRKLIECGVIGYGSPEALAADTPWLAPEYIKAAVTRKAKPKKETSSLEVFPEAAPALNQETDLLEAILAHKGLTTQQRVQLTAVVTLVLSGVSLNVSIAPRGR